MQQLNELLQLHSTIALIVRKEHFTNFLQYAKKQNYLWASGDIIKPNTDKMYTQYFIIKKEGFIHQPTSSIGHMALNSLPKYEYANFLQNNETTNKSTRTQKIDNLYQKQSEKAKISYQEKCEINKKINQIQNKYQEIYKTLPSHFYVRLENDDQLLRLYQLLEKYGYENIYGISLEKFKIDPKIICLDNEQVTYYPATLQSCLWAIGANKKIYDFNTFEAILMDIFKPKDS